MIAAGTTGTRIVITRLRSDGTADPTFANGAPYLDIFSDFNFTTQHRETVTSVAVGPNDQIAISGYVTFLAADQVVSFVAEFNKDGLLNPHFTGTGVFFPIDRLDSQADQATRVRFQGDKLLVSGGLATEDRPGADRRRVLAAPDRRRPI